MASLQERVIEVGKKMMRRKTTKRDPPPTESLTKVLGWGEMIMFGLGAIIGAGIFVLTGVAAREKAGPSITLSFLLDGLVCVLSALTYSECASRVPLTGSAYVYTYVTLGEFPGFLIGWALSLEYGFSVSTVARGWSGYVRILVSTMTGQIIPTWLYEWSPATGILIDFIAGISVIGVTVYMMLGMKSSAWMNNIITGISIAVVVLVISYGATFVDSTNWSADFFPFGFSGTLRGASFVFFAYVGFDSLANFGEESKNPNVDLPVGIVGSLALIVTGMVPYATLDIDAPLSAAFAVHGAGWASIVISIGALAALTTAMLVSLLGQARILFSMARDGLLPSYLGRLDRRSREPVRAQVVTGVFCFFLAVFLDIEKLSELVSMGTLFAFTIVNLSVLILRHRDFLEDKVQREKEIEKEGTDKANENEGFAAVYGPHSFWYHVFAFSSLMLVTSLFFRFEKIIPACIFASVSLVPIIFMNIYFYKHNKLRDEHEAINRNETACEHKENQEKMEGQSEGGLFARTEEQLELEELEREEEKNQHRRHHHTRVQIHARKEFFKAPFAPTTPLLGMGINIFLLCQTLAVSWLFFSVWMGVAVIIYFTYGYSHSKEKDAHLYQPEVSPEKNSGLLNGQDDALSSSFSYDYSMDFNSSSDELAD